MLRIKNSQKGFTIVELLIVIVVIGILAALVINTFSGVQKRARDSERQTDIKALISQIEAYYQNNDRYPVATEITTTNLPGLDAAALKNPKGAAGLTAATNATQTSNTAYYYWAQDDAGAACTVALASCQTFCIYAPLENGTGAVFRKRSLNVGTTDNISASCI